MKTDILKAALFTPMSKDRWGLPLLFWSNPGEGKTSVIEEVCADFGLPCTVLSPGEMGEGAFGVIPVPDKSGVIKYPPPEWTLNHDDKGGVVIIDEMSSTPPALQPPLLGLLFARRIGGKTLSGRTRVIGAANPPEVAAGGFDLAPPVANRCGHINWSAPSPEEHGAYMMRGSTGGREDNTKQFDAEVEERRVLSTWPDAWAWAVGLETAWLRRKPSAKNACPKANDPKASKAWPSDRSWENATRALAAARVHGLSEVSRDEFVASFIGSAHANEWFTFIQEQDLPDPGDVLDGRSHFKHERARLDRTAAVIGSCVSLVSPLNAAKRDQRAVAMWSLVGELAQDKTLTDVLVSPVHTLVKAKLHAKAGGVKFLAEINQLLKAAGITKESAGF
jgi:MoxR-like ATPase